MDCNTSCTSTNENYTILLSKALSLIPISHYILAILATLFTYLYNFLELHFLHDLFFTAFRGDPVSLSYNSSSQLYHSVASKCHLLHSRYLPTPWLSGPHIQTAFLSFFERAPLVNYRRQLFHTPDGGTLALDWVMHSLGEACSENQIYHDGKMPIAVIVPGLTSDSSAAYVKHMAFALAKRGWTVVVSNHRGLGGIAITSDCFYNAGWTDDVRRVIGYIHCQFPEAPIFAIGTSIGANILIKYLGEEGMNIPVAGAAAVCSPWDLLICDRFMNRRLVQRLYNRVLAVGLQGYAKLHQVVISRLTDWDSITKSRSVRDFDNYATRVLGRYETVDTYYRRCSSVNFVGNVAIPLLCISALDDPVCTREAIPWDECRANENIILAVTQHGGHLAYYEGVSASHMWWTRAVDEFLSVLYSSPYMHKAKKMSASPVPAVQESSIDQGPYVNITKDGMVAAVDEEIKDVEDEQTAAQIGKECESSSVERDCIREEIQKGNSAQLSKEYVTAILDPVRRRLDQLSRRNRKSVWLLVYIAVITTWPLVGSAVVYAFKKKWKRMLPAKMLKQ